MFTLPFISPKQKLKFIHIVRDKAIIIVGILLIILWIIVTSIIFNKTFIPIRNYVHKYSKILTGTSAINNDLTEIDFNAKKIIFYKTYKPRDYEYHLEKRLDRLTTLINKTDKDYKGLLALFPYILKKRRTGTSFGYFDEYVKKSYYHWEYVSKPIIKRFIKHRNSPYLKLSKKFLFLYILNSPILSTSRFNHKISSEITSLTYFSALIFIIGTIITIFLGMLFTYYLNKFFKTIKKSEKRFKMMFSNNPIASLITDIKTGDIIIVNKAAERFYGYSKKELTAMNVVDIALSGKDFYNKNIDPPVTKIFNHKLKNNDIKRVEVTISKIEIDGKEYFISSIQDMTEKIIYENSLKESADFFMTLSENLVSGIVLYNDKYVYVNPEGERIIGYPKEELYQKYVWDIYVDENVKQLLKSQIRRRLNGGMFNSNYTFKIITKQNSEKWLLIYASTVKYKGKYTALASFIDITELNDLKKNIEKERDTLKIIMDSVPSIIGLYREKIIYVNPYGLQSLGYSEKEIAELSVLDLIETREEERAFILENTKRRLNGEYFNEKYVLKVKKKDGNIFWGEIFATTAFFKNKWTGVIIVTDVNERVVNETKLLKEKNIYKKLAELDGLTKIPNRRSFDKKLADCLNISTLKGIRFSLIMFDIDEFKKINDTFGHQIGDTVLSEIVSLIEKNIRKDDFFARFGGEEFMIIALNTRLEKAVELAEKLRFNIAVHDFPLKINVTCSFGVTESKPGDTNENMIYKADMALYKAKERGKNRVRTFKPLT